MNKALLMVLPFMFMGLGSLGSVMTGKRSRRDVSLNDKSTTQEIWNWFVDLTAEEQEKIYRFPKERRENVDVNMFLSRRHIQRTVEKCVNNNPKHAWIKFDITPKIVVDKV